MKGFATYVDYWKRYFDFSGKSTRTQYWMVFLIQLLISAIFSVFIAIPAMKTAFTVIDSIWGIVNLIPGLAICVRRLRDGGKSWANIFWVLLPIIGVIVLIVKLCAPSIEEEKPVEPTTAA